MKTRRLTSLSRRNMLGGLTTLPVFLARAMAEDSPTLSQQFSRVSARPASADQVLNVMDFEALRARLFNDLQHPSTTLSVFGTHWPSPLYASAVSAMRAFHPETEIAVARAAKTRSTQFMLSTGASCGTCAARLTSDYLPDV